MEALHQRISRLEAGLGVGFDNMEAVPEKELGEYEGRTLYLKHCGRYSGCLTVTLERYDRGTGKKTVITSGGDRQVLGPGAVLYRKTA